MMIYLAPSLYVVQFAEFKINLRHGLFSLYFFLGSAVVASEPAQKHTVYPLDRAMSKSRTEKAELLDKLYDHGAIKYRLSPSHPEDKVNISVDILVKKVFGIDEHTQIIDSFVHFRVTWQDCDLIWDPQEYSGLELVHLDKEKLWYPILNVVNAGDGESFIVDADQVVSLRSNGTAEYHTTKFLKSICSLDLADYPTDVQNCQINIIPSVITPEVRIEHAGILLTQEGQFDVKGAWKIVNISVELGKLPRFSFINVHLGLRRRALFYTVCLLLPLFVTSLLTVFVFLIPPKAGEKVSFLVSIVLANTMMLNLLGDIIPHSIDKMPNFLMFIVGVIVENFLAFVCTFIVIWKHEQEQKTETPGVCRTPSVPGRHPNLDEPFADPRSITSKNINYSTGKSCQRSFQKCSKTVSPESPNAAANKAQSLSGGCFPFASETCITCRSRLKDWFRKVLYVRACTLDKIFFIIFLFVFLLFTAVTMVW